MEKNWKAVALSCMFNKANAYQEYADTATFSSAKKQWQEKANAELAAADRYAKFHGVTLDDVRKSGAA